MISNRPGLPAIDYRIGTFASFFEAMKDELSSAQFPSLGALKTREIGDWSIALFDAWAAVADVLTFYQERIANEGYLRTATEQLSLVELGRTVGYTLRPGVAATTYLGYTLDPNTDITIPVGTRTQSVPAQGEMPQSFETANSLHAKGDWNALPVRTSRPQAVDLGSSIPSSLLLQGTNLSIHPSDILLLVDGRAAESSDSNEPLKGLARVTRVAPYTPPGSTSATMTAVELASIFSEGREPQRDAIRKPPVDVPPVSVLQAFDKLKGPLLAPPAEHPANALRLEQTQSEAFGTDSDAIAQALSVLHPSIGDTLIPALEASIASGGVPAQAYAFTIDALPFGANAPKQTEVPGTRDPKDEPLPTVEWRLANDERPQFVYLDRAYPALVAGGFAVLETPTEDRPEHGVEHLRWLVARVEDVLKLGRAEYGISGTVSRIELSLPWYHESARNEVPLPITGLRLTHVHAQSTSLALAPAPIADPISGSSIELNGVYDGLDPGRWLVVSGTRTDLPGVPGSELVMLESSRHTIDPNLPGDTLHTTLTLASPLAYAYDRTTVTVAANVVRATHGETRTETLGSGDGTAILQTFTLKAFPLTYVPAMTPSGVASTLQVAVNGVPWTEAPNFDALRPNDRTFVTRTDSTGMTSVMFGDGIHGARLPTGAENVTATYRVGIGQSGNLAPAQLTLLANRPLSVRSVTNPLAPAGGADGENVDAARANVPYATAALDRIVSVSDYAAFARTFAGVAKAAARRFPGAPPVVEITIAADGDEPIAASSALAASLESAMRLASDTAITIDVQPRTLIVLVVSARISLLAGYQWETVSPAITTRLLSDFGFDARALGQSVYLTEIIASIAGVPGVCDVAISSFDGFSEEDASARLTSFGDSRATVKRVIHAASATRGAGARIVPAQLAVFTSALPQSIILQVAEG